MPDTALPKNWQDRHKNSCSDTPFQKKAVQALFQACSKALAYPLYPDFGDSRLTALSLCLRLPGSVLDTSPAKDRQGRYESSSPGTSFSEKVVRAKLPAVPERLGPKDE